VTENVVIIGSGPAAWSAAIYAARAELKPLVYEGAETQENQESGTLPLGQLNLTTEVENYAGFPAGNLQEYLDSALPESIRGYMAPATGHGITGPELMELQRQQAKNFGTRVITDDIVSVDFSTRPFTLVPRGGGEVKTHTVIVATGARANYLGLPSEQAYKNRGVSACAVCDGALPRFRNKPLVVVGGGDSAMEEGTYLAKFASRVYMIIRRDVLRASPIMARRAQENDKIEFVWNSVVEEVIGDDKNGVSAVKLASTVGGEHKTLEAAGLFLAIGHTPNTDFLGGQLKLNDKGYVELARGDRTYTSVDGVFAAGDVADDYYRQAITAAGTGCRAALDAERWLAEKNVHG
jgi:thioredoxin reductase (NADPH)